MIIKHRKKLQLIGVVAALSTMINGCAAYFGDRRFYESRTSIIDTRRNKNDCVVTMRAGSASIIPGYIPFSMFTYGATYLAAWWINELTIQIQTDRKLTSFDVNGKTDYGSAAVYVACVAMTGMILGGLPDLGYTLIDGALRSNRLGPRKVVIEYNSRQGYKRSEVTNLHNEGDGVVSATFENFFSADPDDTSSINLQTSVLNGHGEEIASQSNRL